MTVRNSSARELVLDTWPYNPLDKIYQIIWKNIFGVSTIPKVPHLLYPDLSLGQDRAFLCQDRAGLLGQDRAGKTLLYPDLSA